MEHYWEEFKTPFLCFAGYSGVGKTTLLERLIRRFRDEHIRVGYYKHDAHRFTMDKEGKDTFRASHAGAGIVTINDPRHFAVIADNGFKERTVIHALEQCDCILIEGYKQSPYDKVVFLDAEGKLPIPLDTPGIKVVVHQGAVPGGPLKETGVPLFHRDEVDGIYRFVREHFKSRARPLYGAVFVGGQSTRMGRPKFSLVYNGQAEAERMLEIMRPFCEKMYFSSRANLDMSALSPIPGVERIDDEHIGLGPVGGLATLMGRFPDRAWLIAACDMPLLDEQSFQTIVRERDPLRYGTCYVQKANLGYEPMCAVYEPKFVLPLYEAMAKRELSLSRIISQLPFKEVKITEERRARFTNTNTPEEYEFARSQRDQEKIKS
ncbi:MAG: molybdopterin-guanine dinucleotide biosynthesis protein B [Nitrospinae bacterium CG11_big_fil_rev_8_21_14_0_20_56_8]|nr:MAG: molybdopterin-guanine dinucleotide biosynthesis protein B [Nitrospinae bacterium CG11_big_fil_rev_8_21_14_0_20_56_8]